MQFKLGIVGPRTQIDAPTGVVVDITIFKELRSQGARLSCPECREEHAWSAAGAQLDLGAQSSEAAARVIVDLLEKRGVFGNS